MSCNRLVLVGLGFAVAMTGLGCGKSCVDVVTELTEASRKCIAGDTATRCKCLTDAVQIALDEDACNGELNALVDVKEVQCDRYPAPDTTN